jgi:hypothetical protein
VRAGARRVSCWLVAGWSWVSNWVLMAGSPLSVRGWC